MTDSADGPAVTSGDEGTLGACLLLVLLGLPRLDVNENNLSYVNNANHGSKLPGMGAMYRWSLWFIVILSLDVYFGSRG